MFTEEPKHGQSELQLSVNSLSDLQLGDVIASDGCNVYFAAEVKQQCQGSVFGALSNCSLICSH